MVFFAVFLLVTVSPSVLGCFTSTNLVSLATGTLFVSLSRRGFKKCAFNQFHWWWLHYCVIKLLDSLDVMFLIWLSQTELKLRSTKNQTVAEQLAVLFQVSPVPLVFHSNKSTIRIHPENLQRCFRPFGSYSPKCSVLQSKTYSLVFGSIKPVCVAGDGEPEVWTVFAPAAAERSDSGNEWSPRWIAGTWTCHFSFTETSNARPDERSEGARWVGETDQTFKLPLRESNGRKMSVFQQEQTSSPTDQAGTRTAWSRGTPASTTRFWTRPGAQPTPPPSSRCVTAMSNGMVRQQPMS